MDQYMFVFALLFAEEITAVPPCNSPIFCDGPLLKTVQLAEPKLFNDSKTFVDMHLRHDQEVVLSAFSNLTQYHNYTREDLKTFVTDYFAGPGAELENWTPNDTVSNPKFLKHIQDSRLKVFGGELCNIWAHLGRKIKKDVELNPQRYSLIYLPNPFIVPGGRFREIYYWDSYWVVKGLLTCEMYTTVKGMLENMLTFVERIGKVPNGGRIYYTERSQPPLLIPMASLYFEATNDVEFIKKHIGTLEKEYHFWMTERNVSITTAAGETHVLNRYATPLTKPRPESFREDFKTAQNLSKDDAETLYSNLGSGAESGWDFSSRWFAHQDGSSSLLDIIVRDIIPVDLNSILCWNERLLSWFYGMQGNEKKSNEYKDLSEKRQKAIDDVLWNDNSGIWFDYNHKTKQQRQHFYPSNVFPLYVRCYPNNTNTDYNAKARNYLLTTGALNFTSGIPTSLISTGQQWDLPNGWPPLQEIVVTALDNAPDGSGWEESHDMALDVVKKWVYSNWKGWNRTDNMFEKYSVNVFGSRGGGGEYDVQEGFGWTNGVILDFLSRYGAELTLDEFINEPATAHTVKYNVNTQPPDTCDAATCGAHTRHTFSIYLACLFISSFPLIVF